MNRATARNLLPAALAALLCLSPSVDARAPKKLKKGDAQKLIASLSLLRLNKGAVVVKEIAPTESGANVLAGVKVAVRFERDAGGAWRAAAARTGDRQWEDFELLAPAAGPASVALARAALDSFAAELESLARAKAEEEKREKQEESGEGKEKDGGKGGDQGGSKNKGKGQPAPPEEPELVRGALSVQKPAEALSAVGKSAVVEVQVGASFEVVRDGGKWRVASVTVAGERFQDFAGVERALDAGKTARARADLESLAAALDAYRRERGFYVVADSGTVLVDHLNPRYTRLYVRFDPWHRPYEYEGEASRYTLRSNGPDGKQNTADDVVRNSGR